jgi:hypothetical protein
MRNPDGGVLGYHTQSLLEEEAQTGRRKLKNTGGLEN